MSVVEGRADNIARLELSAFESGGGSSVRLSHDTFEAGIYRSYRRGRYTGHRARRVYQILNKARPAAQLLFADMPTQQSGNFEGGDIRFAALRQYLWQHVKD